MFLSTCQYKSYLTTSTKYINIFYLNQLIKKRISMNLSWSQGPILQNNQRTDDNICDSSQLQLGKICKIQIKPLSQPPTLQIFHTIELLPQCRICLQNITPQNVGIDLGCQCKGANLTIHKKCFLAWSQKKLKREQNTKHYYTECDLCKSRINLQVEQSYRMLTYKQLSKLMLGKQLSHTILFLCLIILSLITIATAIALLACMENITKLLTIIMVAGIAAPFSIIVIIIAYIYYEFAFEYKNTIVGVVMEKGKTSADQQSIDKNTTKIKIKSSQVENQNIV